MLLSGLGSPTAFLAGKHVDTYAARMHRQSPDKFFHMNVPVPIQIFIQLLQRHVEDKGMAHSALQTRPNVFGDGMGNAAWAAASDTHGALCS